MTAPASSPVEPQPAPRARWMGVLAGSEPRDVHEVAAAALPRPTAFHWLRKPETGLVLVRGRMGGTGAPFNLGEMAVTRCTLRLGDGTVGASHVRGRDARHAEQAALLDALLQRAEIDGRLEWEWQRCIAPLEKRLQAAREQRAAAAAATRVEFFTVARGDNP